MSAGELKPWPADAVMIVAARAGTERREMMEGVSVQQCRDCGCTVHADTFTIERALTLPERRGRLLKFFCRECHLKYKIPENVERHNTPAGRAAARRALHLQKVNTIADMTLAEKIEWLGNQCNEIAFGYNDSGCFWHMSYGKRGAGNMIQGIGERISALGIEEDGDFEKSIDFFILEMKRRLMQ